MNNKASAVIGGIILLVLVIVVCVGYFVNIAYVNTYYIEGTIVDKWVDVYAEESAYLVKIENNRMLEVQRNLWYGGKEYNPDVIYSNLKINSTYKFKCWGLQIDFAGIYCYPNIIEAKLITDSE